MDMAKGNLWQKGVSKKMDNKSRHDKFHTKRNASAAYVFRHQEINTNVNDIHNAAHDLFGEMRGSTDEERTAYSGMLDNISTPLDIDIFSD